MKVLVCGQKRFGRDVAELVRSWPGWKLAAISCPVLGASDGRDLDKLHILALNHDVLVIPSSRLDAHSIERVCRGVDLIVAAHCHDFIGRKTRHRGRSAIEWAIRFREPFTGGSVYWLNNTVDGGPIAAQRHVVIRPEDTPRQLWARDLAPLGLKLFAGVFAALDRGERSAVPQDHTLATWEPALNGVPALHRPDLELLPAPSETPSRSSEALRENNKTSTDSAFSGGRFHKTSCSPSEWPSEPPSLLN